MMEAAFALLRLYQVDGDENWLNLVKHLFEKFIKQNYWKYHDHWLSYCTNELVKLNHEEKYYIFGMKNAAGHLDYIKQGNYISYIFRNACSDIQTCTIS